MCRKGDCWQRQGQVDALVDDRQAARAALDGAPLGDAHACEAAGDVAGLNGRLAVHRERAVSVARAIQRPLQGRYSAQAQQVS